MRRSPASSSVLSLPLAFSRRVWPGPAAYAERMTSDAHTSRGSGPGVITPDGCAVELYSLLPPGRDPKIIHDAVGPGASILELGAGASRVTHPLLRLGHEVVAVDESPMMLERIHGAETVRGRIEMLDLGRRFDAVLLASQLVNVPEREARLDYAVIEGMGRAGRLVTRAALILFPAFAALASGPSTDLKVMATGLGVRHPAGCDDRAGAAGELGAVPIDDGGKVRL